MRGLVAYRRPAAALAAVAAAALLPPATCLAAAGSLDRSFDGNGRLVIKTARGGMASAAGPDSELVAANYRRVFRYRANARPRRYFAGNGRAVIPTPAGMSFLIAGVAVDSRGRVLVAGTRKPTGATGGSRNARVSVYRFMPNGKLDASFGKRGLAGAQLGQMEATGLVVDSRNRPVLTGFVSAPTPFFCNTKSSVYLNSTVVARLTTSGAPDPSFGGGSGTFTDPLEDPRLPTLTANGKGIVYASNPEYSRCVGFEGYSGPVGAPVASILSPSGSLALRFPVRPSGPNLPGLASGLNVTSLAVDRKDRIVMLMTAVESEGSGNLQLVRRLLPDGSPDPKFGEYFQPGLGLAWPPAPPPEGPGGWSWAVTTDRRNRVIVGGSLGGEGRFDARAFMVGRLNAAGRAQTWFG
ncbi:MAG TPA: hypothetical protein VFZ41_01320, partial [Solirubrobacterales bacterium]